MRANDRVESVLGAPMQASPARRLEAEAPRRGIASGLAPTATELQDYLVLRYDDLKRHLARRLGCEDLATEALQNLWIRLATRTDVLKPIRNVEAYVYRMACNAAVDYLQTERRLRHTGDAEALFDGMADPAPGPAEIVQARSELQALVRLLEELPSRRRAILLAVGVEELTRTEAAARHAISPHRVERELRNAKRYCAARLPQ